MQSIKSKTVNGMAWNAIDKFAVQGIQFIISIIIARILSPSDYGLIGMLTLFIAVSQLLIDSGFAKALIQKQDRTHIDFSTVFFFNIGFSLLIYLILFFCAPSIAGFYKIPQLVILTRVLALSLIINSLIVVHTAIYTIALDFKSMALINFFSVIISGAIAIVLTFYGYGVWVLVFQTLIRAAVLAICYWIFGNWKPSFEFSKESFKRLFHFGSKLLGSGLLSTFFQNIYTLIIGKAFSAKELGYYTRAVQFAEFSSGTITSILQTVSFPVLSGLQNNKEQLVAVYNKLIRMAAFMAFPLMTMLALLAEPLIRLFLTEKWLPAVPLLQWLCFARMFTPISAINMNILNAIGRSDLFLKLDVSKIPILIIALVITVPIGLKAVVIGNFTVSFICFFINAYYPGKLFNYGAFCQIKEMKKIIISVFIMIIVTFPAIYFLENDFIKLLVGSIVGLMAYLLSTIIFKVEEINDIRKVLTRNK